MTQWELGWGWCCHPSIDLPVTRAPFLGLLPGRAQGEVATSAGTKQQLVAVTAHWAMFKAVSRASRAWVQADIKDSEQGTPRSSAPTAVAPTLNTRCPKTLSRRWAAAASAASWTRAVKKEWLYILYVITEHMLGWHMKSGHSLPV